MTLRAPKLTKAQITMHLAELELMVAKEVRYNVHGMWNPLFCADTADTAILADIRRWLEHVESITANPEVKDD